MGKCEIQRCACRFGERVKDMGRKAWRTLWKVGRDDPRRVTHSLKVGLALTLVSLLYLTEELFEGVGQNAMWAVMTVVVVMEFTAGATLSKGMNRGLGTLSAGFLAVFSEYLGDCFGSRVLRAIFIAFGVFVVGAACSYVRFVPSIKKKYDYGVLIFLLTFNLIAVSSYRVDDIWKMAADRISTIVMGCVICLMMSLFIFPNWSGEDLHNSTISKLEGLAKSIEACVVEYFSDSKKQANEEDDEASEEDPIYKGYKAVLDSKANDESLAIQASWEPRFGRYCLRLPWKQYVEVGAALRQFSYTVVALHGCLQTEIQTPRFISAPYKDSCIRLGQEVSRVLRELANSIRNNRHFCREKLCVTLHQSLQNLNTALKSHPQLFLGSKSSQQKNGEGGGQNEGRALKPQLSKIVMTSVELSEALPFATFTSLLVEMVAKLGNVMDEIEKLGKLGHFRDHDHGVEVVCEKPQRVLPEKYVASNVNGSE